MKTHNIYCRPAANLRESVPTAWSRGVYAIHGGRGRWVVDHLPTGYAVARFRRKTDALALARRLYRDFPTVGRCWEWGAHPDELDPDYAALRVAVLGADL